jgi:putative heme iron utilization protein
MSGDPQPDRPAWAARKLLRAARVGSLATARDGQPFVSLVTPATAPDLSVLLLLSSLAEHTRHLRVEPRCSLMVSGVPETANPQTTPRVTLTGRAEVTEDAGLKSRFLAVHPYATQYAGFTDFALWRLLIEGALFVGGFARAAKLGATALAPAPAAVAAIAAAEAGIIADGNDHHRAALGRIAKRPGAWRMAVVDTDGCDLADGDRVLRVSWSAPMSNPDEVRAELARLAS